MEPDQATIRQELISLLREREMSVRDISQTLSISERDVYDHLPHVERTLRSGHLRLRIAPSRCLNCGYVFKERKRYKPPSRCPRCRATYIEKPLFSIS